MPCKMRMSGKLLPRTGPSTATVWLKKPIGSDDACVARIPNSDVKRLVIRIGSGDVLKPNRHCWRGQH